MLSWYYCSQSTQNEKAGHYFVHTDKAIMDSSTDLEKAATAGGLSHKGCVAALLHNITARF